MHQVVAIRTPPLLHGFPTLHGILMLQLVAHVGNEAHVLNGGSSQITLIGSLAQVGWRIIQAEINITLFRCSKLSIRSISHQRLVSYREEVPHVSPHMLELLFEAMSYRGLSFSICSQPIYQSGIVNLSHICLGSPPVSIPV